MDIEEQTDTPLCDDEIGKYVVYLVSNLLYYRTHVPKLAYPVWVSVEIDWVIAYSFSAHTARNFNRIFSEILCNFVKTTCYSFECFFLLFHTTLYTIYVSLFYEKPHCWKPSSAILSKCMRYFLDQSIFKI